MEYEEVVVIF